MNRDVLEKDNQRLKLDNLQLRSELDRYRELYEGYPQLAGLHRVLGWIWLDAYPLLGAGDEYGTRIRGTGTPTPGAGSVRQRRRLQRSQRLLLEWTERLENDLDGTPQSKGKRPRCWSRTDLHKRGLHLPHGSTLCSVCGNQLKESEVARQIVPVNSQ